MKAIYLTLKEEMVESLDTKAREIGTTRTAIIKSLLHKGLNDSYNQ